MEVIQMLIAKNDEKERSFLFRIVIWTASVLIIVVAAYFLIRSFVKNPIAGTWEYQDDNITMTIQSDDKVELQFDHLQEVSGLEVTLDCQVDKSEKTLVIQAPEQSRIDQILKPVFYHKPGKPPIFSRIHFSRIIPVIFQPKLVQFFF